MMMMMNLIMRAKKLLSSRQIVWYAVPARTITKKALTVSLLLTVLLATTLLLRLTVHYTSTCIFGCCECFTTVDCWI